MPKPEANIPVVLKYVKGRKDYPCSKCSRTILKGAHHFRETGRILGYWINNRFCSNCDLEEINSRVEDTKERLLKERALYIVEEKVNG